MIGDLESKREQRNKELKDGCGLRPVALATGQKPCP